MRWCPRSRPKPASPDLRLASFHPVRRAGRGPYRSTDQTLPSPVAVNLLHPLVEAPVLYLVVVGTSCGQDGHASTVDPCHHLGGAAQSVDQCCSHRRWWPPDLAAVLDRDLDGGAVQNASILLFIHGIGEMDSPATRADQARSVQGALRFEFEHQGSATAVAALVQEVRIGGNREEAREPRLGARARCRPRPDYPPARQGTHATRSRTVRGRYPPRGGRSPRGTNTDNHSLRDNDPCVPVLLSMQRAMYRS